MKIKVEYVVDIKSDGEINALVEHAKSLGIVSKTTSRYVKADILKQLFQKKGEDVRQLPE